MTETAVTEHGTVELEIVKGSGLVTAQGKLICFIDGEAPTFSDDEQAVDVVLIREADYRRLLRAAKGRKR